MKKITLLVFCVISIIIHTNGQNKFYKGENVLLPSNLMVKYEVPLKDSNTILNDSCLDSELPYFSNQQLVDIFPIIVENAFIIKIKLQK